MKQINICLGIFLALAISRFVPHPPNFTSLIALSFYIPALFGRKYIPAIIISFAVTDLIIGFHAVTFFTWGSVLLIGSISNYFSNAMLKRLSGALFGAVIFFVVTNFGVWISGMYGYTLNGFITCYTLAIPFFAYSVISTFMFSFLIEIIYKGYQFKRFKSYI